MTEAVIVDAVRTPGGKRNGQFRDEHPVNMAAQVLKALEERNGLDPAMVDDVIMGCVMQVGEQSLNIGRNAVLAAGWPERSLRQRWTASAVRASSPCTSPHRVSLPARMTSLSPQASRS